MKIVKDIDYSKLRRGSTVFEIDKEKFDWPNCEVSGCNNQICIGMSKTLCYVHGIEFKAFTEKEFEESRRNRK